MKPRFPLPLGSGCYHVLMPLIVAAIGIPTAIMAWRSGKDRSLERQVETLTREIETLKQQRIVSP